MHKIQYPDINWPAFEAFWSITIVTISFLIYHFVSQYQKNNNKHSENITQESNSGQILGQRLLGFLLFGIIPGLVVLALFRLPWQGYGLNFLSFKTTIFWVVILSPVIVLMNHLNASKNSNLSVYPQIRQKNWTLYKLSVSAISWVFYLVAYEFMFRGFLLFTFYHAYGPELAISVNTSVYALVHLPKGMKETLGAIPLGIILCILTLSTGNIWIAVFIHIIMALSNEWMSVKAHPQMSIIWKR